MYWNVKVEHPLERTRRYKPRRDFDESCDVALHYWRKHHIVTVNGDAFRCFVYAGLRAVERI